MSPRILPLVLAAFVACTGGGGAIGENGSSSGTSSSSSGSTSSSGSSGGSSGGSSSGSVNACTEFVAGTIVDEAIGGSATSKVLVQAASDYGGAAAMQVFALTAACKDIAVALDAASSDQTAAEGQTDSRLKLKAWCSLAVKSLGTIKATAGGTLTVQVDPTECGLSVVVKAECQGRCAGTGPCDTTANPMTCTGGELSNGLCRGGKLQGGCQVDARCDAGCDATVASKASCPKPTVSITSTGASDPTAAAKLETTLEAELPAILALRAQCEAEASIASSFSGNVSSVTDIKAACIPPVVSAVTKSAQDVQACVESAAGVAATVQ